MNFCQIVLAEFAGVAALPQEFGGRKLAEMQPSARAGFVRCCLKETHPTDVPFGGIALPRFSGRALIYW
jgi:hypothetical protein